MSEALSRSAKTASLPGLGSGQTALSAARFWEATMQEPELNASETVGNQHVESSPSKESAGPLSSNRLYLEICQGLPLPAWMPGGSVEDLGLRNGGRE